MGPFRHSIGELQHLSSREAVFSSKQERAKFVFLPHSFSSVRYSFFDTDYRRPAEKFS